MFISQFLPTKEFSLLSILDFSTKFQFSQRQPPGIPSGAGVTDSALTNHGILQIERLARHFRTRGVGFTQIFASPLQRARLTAEGLCAEASRSELRPVFSPLLIEKDFGSLEGKSWRSAAALSTVPSVECREPESAASMIARVNHFLNDFIFPNLHSDKEADEVIAIVSHGIVLSVLWQTLTKLCRDSHLVVGGTVCAETRRPGWSNTGYMEFDMTKAPTLVADSVYLETTSLRRLETDAHLTSDAHAADHPSGIALKITVHAINSRGHLHTLKRTGSGIGSAKHDPKQKRISSYFSNPSVG
ncbi:predicted protein [Uncinocarpus reesii 1704]|uniref:Phosphoglycerate mutase n=1 Tax=Uncinocarpus reesii (strain UAMH 1704) TaxID=336963 RepID=C4JXA3_UNCRE|nr:uncharacterized protein UREG_06276 [Uncinocarpus reesii 1704]EEP81411.1 predicted protein [Uncinocarpus reesii 1704]